MICLLGFQCTALVHIQAWAYSNRAQLECCTTPNQSSQPRVQTILTHMPSSLEMRTATVPATLSVANITMCVSRTVALTSYLPLLVPLKEAIIALPCICFVSRSSLQSLVILLAHSPHAHRFKEEVEQTQRRQMQPQHRILGCRREKSEHGNGLYHQAALMWRV